MQLGELFFSLGFTSKGTGEAKAFGDTIVTTQQSANVLSQAIEHLIFLVEEMAVKMGAVTRGDLDASKSLIKEKSAIDGVESSGKKNVETKKKTVGVVGTLNQKMKDYWGSMNAARLQMIALGAGLTYFVKKASDAAVHIDKLSTLTGYSKDGLQRMGDMAAQTGTNLDDVAGAISNFQKQSIDISLGRGGNIGAYNLLGLNPHEDPVKLLDQIGRKLKTLPAAYGANLARDLGLSDDLIYMLKNMENIKPPRQETFLTDKEVKRLKEFNFYFNRVFEQGKRTLQKFAAFLSPVVSELISLADRISYLASKGMNALEPYLEKLKPFGTAIKLIGIALFAAIFPATAAFLFLAVVLEDIAGYINGDKSFFGAMINYLKDTKTMTEDLTAAYATLIDMLTFGTMDKDKIFKMAGNKLTNEQFDALSDEDKKRWSVLTKIRPGESAPSVQDIMDTRNASRANGGVVINQQIHVQGDMTTGSAKILRDIETGHINLGIKEAQ